MDEFDLWYREHYPAALAAMVLFCAGENAIAEDAINDAFVRALEDWDQVRMMSSPTGWTVRVAMNEANRTFRRRTRRIALLNSQRIEHVVSDTEPDGGIWTDVQQLPTRQREAIVLRYIEALPQELVAKRMGVAVGTASATLTQARENLRTAQRGES